MGLSGHPHDGSPLVAVLAALAGVRTGAVVTAVGATPLVERALAAAAGHDAVAPRTAASAAVVVAGASYDVPLAVTLLAPGGRLVAVAADAGAAERTAVAHGLLLRHVVRLDRGVAWSAVLPADP